MAILKSDMHRALAEKARRNDTTKCQLCFSSYNECWGAVERHRAGAKAQAGEEK
ncbi:hypothetical protein BDZ89DRAFT_1067435 [Hymenopellis radicata]|nr:hypothetical protein BDZ89DRAFT_1067435 [Hymenopellis radicata]